MRDRSAQVGAAVSGSGCGAARRFVVRAGWASSSGGLLAALLTLLAPGAVLAQSCPAGWYLGPEETCLQCLPGTYSTVWNTLTCTVCPTGTVAPDYASTFCSSCDPGTSNDAGHLSCVPCAPGTANPEIGGACTDCPAGAFSSTPGSLVCEACTPGTSSAPGSVTCDACAPGTANPSSGGLCVECPADTFAAVAGSEACLTCPSYFGSPPGATTCSALLLPAFTQTDTYSNSGWGVNTTRGWAFSVSQPIVIEELGFWDSSEDGLARSHPVGLWRGDGTLLASETVPAGTLAPLEGTFRWIPLTTAVALTPGETYVVGAYWIAGDPDTALESGEEVEFDARVTLLEGRATVVSGLAYPWQAAGLELTASFKARAVEQPPAAVPVLATPVRIVLVAAVTALAGLLAGRSRPARQQPARGTLPR